MPTHFRYAHTCLRAIAIVIAIIQAPHANAAEDAQLTPSPGAASDYFGTSMSISGNRAVVGASGDDTSGTDVGAAYVYELIGGSWVEQAKLVPVAPASDDRFGDSVAISGDTLLVGASRDDGAGRSEQGAVFVYRFDGSTWVYASTLRASDGMEGDWFGAAISLSGDTALIGAPHEDGDGLSVGQQGAAYVFRFDGLSWVEEAKLTAGADERDQDWMGGAVSIDGDTAVVGAAGARDGAGTAYVFYFDGNSWARQGARLITSFGRALDAFGGSVSVSGSAILVGAHNAKDSAGGTYGRAYLFGQYGANWVEVQVIEPSDLAFGDRFGASVSISGETAVIGSSLDDDNGSASGGAYVFHWDDPSFSFVEVAKLLPSDAEADAWFGSEAALDGGRAIIGAPRHDGRRGAAYVFEGLAPAGPPVPVMGGAGLLVLSGLLALAGLRRRSG